MEQSYTVITLTQPWATLVAIGAKKIETRSWATKYRGPLLIHAAAGYGKGGLRGHKELCGTEPFCSILNAACKRHYDQLGDLRAMVEHPFMPTGAIIARCELLGCELVSYEWPNNQAVYYTGKWGRAYHGHKLTPQERAFGDYTPGRYAWLLSDVQALPTPIPAKGQLGLWTWRGALPA